MTAEKNPSSTPRTGPAASPSKASPEPVNLSSQSVAGEEDPGASLDISDAPARPQASSPISMPGGVMHPGDEAPEGTPGTGESICRECGGSGQVGDGPCPSCDGNGKVIVGVGGA